MKAYLVAQVHIHNHEEYAKYIAASGPLIKKYNGVPLVRGGKVETLEGETYSQDRIVIVEFPSIEDARAWYNSPEYSSAKLLRKPYSNAQFIVVEGA